MSFQPVLPAYGYAGWILLKRTMPAQAKAFQQAPVNQRDAEYFRNKIGTVTTADDLVSDRRLLKIALSAFGLEQDINAKAFVKKILSDGVDSPKDLSNRLADKSYRAFASSFGLDGTQLPKTLDEGFADALLDQYYVRQFEAAVGEQNDSFRLALNAEREIGKLAASAASEDTKWFTIMGNKPLRQVFEKSFGLPAGFSNLDIDQQLRVLKSRAQSQFGASTVSQFSESTKMEKLVRNFIVRESLTTMSNSPARNALVLLAARRGTAK
ncbi:DUF1217 domain-containing protein [Rhodobacter sp. 24-YEA-8]|uniref:DUF1217 domain-containing protein n=1 Tax=Rhodobacter sp. 24-YEA-8 TaxID=1884310 RepID=UPI0008990B73|nr:DUF1217 domain-containing protein [Rhodobacter sp. 24-YEA-8]SEC61947.1 Protein of unknown function [Rhodobacter sp. 24-YEA-8]